ncbi:MAG: hypothetical protein P8P98_06870 [Emcibacteraceae bacterium]|nr:hypothetical protein [Emcibacteraceae bacterium]MDG1858451.1 hypothetical protein [Emcibacteraceae bacterium]
MTANDNDELLHGQSTSSIDAASLHFTTGCQYLYGDDDKNVEPDYEKALFSLHKAAQSGHGLAAYNLGLMAINGHGCKRDAVSAMKWFMIAKSLDPEVSLANIDDIMPELCEDQHERAQCAALGWLKDHPAKSMH